MKESKILLIGGSGFIGSQLTKQLSAAGHEVQILDKEISSYYPDQTIVCDIRNKDKLIKIVSSGDYEVIYNLAAEHKDNVTPRSLYDEVNVRGAENVCAAAEAGKVSRIIFTSSVAVYGFTNQEADENQPINYFNDYGRTKWEAEEVYRSWLAGNPERSLTIIRPTVVFGPENRGNVYNLLRQLASRAFIMVGGGKNKKSMAYVENIAAFLVFVLRLSAGEHLFNYVDKPDFDMNTLVKEVKRALGKKPKVGLRLPYWLGYLAGLGFDLLSFITKKKFPISAIRIKKFCSSTLISSDRAFSTDFKAPVKIEEGMARTIEKEFKNK